MSIDWAKQWEAHAPNFHNGESLIDLSIFGRSGSLRLLPGGGFGDTSHPTTRLVLQLMANEVQARTLIDIGCGSGILSLAALKWGATSAIGIDIEEEAIEHAKHNASLNQLAAHFSRQLPPVAFHNPLIVINMISSEQRLAWNSCPLLHHLHCPVIASGILLEHRDHYLAEVKAHRNWHLLAELQEDNWCAFLFTQCFFL